MISTVKEDVSLTLQQITTLKDTENAEMQPNLASEVEDFLNQQTKKEVVKIAILEKEVEAVLRDKKP